MRSGLYRRIERLLPPFSGHGPTLLELSKLPGRNEENLLAVSAEPFVPLKSGEVAEEHAKPLVTMWRTTAGPQCRKLYANALRHVLRPSFYANLRLENSFGLQHRLLLVHVWLLKMRLELGLAGDLEEVKLDTFVSSDALHLKNEIVNFLWTHHRRICRVADVPSGQIIKYRKLLHIESMDFFLDLDDAFAEAIKQSKMDYKLGTACPFFPVIFKHVFLSTEEAKPYALLFQKYMITEFNRLERIPLNEVLKGNVEWMEVPKLVENQPYR